MASERVRGVVGVMVMGGVAAVRCGVCAVGADPTWWSMSTKAVSVVLKR